MRDLERLVDVLGRERKLMDVLVFRLVTLRALLVSGDGRYLAWAAEEVEDATGAVRAAELHRALLISHIAGERGLPDESLTLAVLVDLVDPPWRTLLADHRAGLRALADQIDDQASAVRRLARTSSASLATVLDRLVGEPVRT
jgi:hypothetical protein